MRKKRNTQAVEIEFTHESHLNASRRDTRHLIGGDQLKKFAGQLGGQLPAHHRVARHYKSLTAEVKAGPGKFDAILEAFPSASILTSSGSSRTPKVTVVLPSARPKGRYLSSQRQHGR